MLVLKYTDGEEELEEVDFIDLSDVNDPSVQEHLVFRMKGGHKVRDAHDD